MTGGCGFPLHFDDPVPATELPTDEALKLLRTQIDPLGVRDLEIRSLRRQALATMFEAASSL